MYWEWGCSAHMLGLLALITFWSYLLFVVFSYSYLAHCIYCDFLSFLSLHSKSLCSPGWWEGKQKKSVCELQALLAEVMGQLPAVPKDGDACYLGCDGMGHISTRTTEQNQDKLLTPGEMTGHPEGPCPCQATAWMGPYNSSLQFLSYSLETSVAKTMCDVHVWSPFDFVCGEDMVL